MASRALSYAEAKRFYDRFGRKQDLQRFYEDPALDALVREGDFERARAVVEVGCGTGRLAQRLLSEHLPEDATYLGLDLSATMVELSRARLGPWAERASVQLTDGTPTLPIPDDGCDRVVSTYVLDLLSEQDMRAVVTEARRVLAPDGRLCLASLTFGRGWIERAIGSAWRAMYRLRPSLVGGCRPVRLEDVVDGDWQVLFRDVVCRYGICTEVLVAQ